MRGQPGGKLLTLEAGRFFAALAVLLYHLTTIVANFRGVVVFGDVFRPGHAGVPYFFVLSGFIIYHVHRGDVGRPDRFTRFALRRIARIYPMFWLISFAMLAAFLLVPSLAAQRSIDPVGLVADLTLLPHGDAVLPISWTLRHEIVFYAFFSMAIWFGPRAFWAIALWIAVSFWLGFVVPLTEDTLGSASVVAGSLNLGFGLGIVTAALLHRRSVAPPSLWIALGGSLMAALWVVEWRMGHHVDHSVEVLGVWGDIGYLCASAMLIYGLAKAEAHWRLPWAGTWKILGGSSYLLYLIHQPVASVAMRGLRKFPALAPEAAYIMVAVLAIGAAVAMHLTVEQWIMKRLNGALRRREAMATANLKLKAK